MTTLARSIFVSSLFAISASPLHADAFARLGIDFGGEKISELEYTDGSSDSLYTGGGSYIELGFSHQTPVLNNPSLVTELAVGYKTDSSDASNISISFSRFTASATQFVKMGQWRFGAGITGHFRNKLSVSGSAVRDDSDMVNNSYGVALVADYHFSDQLQFGVKAVSMDYVNYGDSIDANSYGIFIGSKF